MKFITFLFLLFFSVTTLADIKTEMLKVTGSNCALLAKEDSTTSTIAGGGVGAAAGGIFGYIVGGRTGAKIGAVAGGGTGALIGHNTVSKTYNCKLLVEREGKTILFQGTTDKNISTGYLYKFAVEDGKLIDIF